MSIEMANPLEFLQSASNAIAGNVSGPVDMAAWGLRKLGVPVPANPLGGSQWMSDVGLTKPVPQNALSLAGETFGLVGPMAVTAKAPQVAALLNRAGANAAVPRALNPQKGAVVYHGSPHKFDQFDSSKIGTGEGAQAYGHGLYLADTPTVARSYKQAGNFDMPTLALTDGTSIPVPRWSADLPANEKATRTIADAISVANEKGQDVIKAVELAGSRLSGEARAAFDVLRPKVAAINEVGNLYKVDLPDEQIAKMLDWDKPLSEQPKNVRAALRLAAMKDRKKFGEGGGIDYYRGDPDSYSGESLYRHLSEQVSDWKDASTGLAKARIPGIKYLDANSRDAGEGTYNYVVFPGEEKNLRILERNGEIMQKFQDRVNNLGVK